MTISFRQVLGTACVSAVVAAIGYIFVVLMWMNTLGEPVSGYAPLVEELESELSEEDVAALVHYHHVLVEIAHEEFCTWPYCYNDKAEVKALAMKEARVLAAAGEWGLFVGAVRVARAYSKHGEQYVDRDLLEAYPGNDLMIIRARGIQRLKEGSYLAAYEDFRRLEHYAGQMKFLASQINCGNLKALLGMKPDDNMYALAEYPLSAVTLTKEQLLVLRRSIRRDSQFPDLTMICPEMQALAN